MKKLNLIILILVLSFNTLSQWQTKHYVDDFGDETEETYEAFIATGKFTNSATTNSKAIYAFIKDESILQIKVYEYGNKLATSIEGTLEVIKIKNPKGDVIKIKGVMFSKKGFLYFSKKRYNKIIEAISMKGDYIMIFNRSGKYSNSDYKVEFTIE